MLHLYRSFSLANNAVGTCSSAVCDYGISWSYSLFFVLIHYFIPLSIILTLSLTIRLNKNLLQKCFSSRLFCFVVDCFGMFQINRSDPELRMHFLSVQI